MINTAFLTVYRLQEVIQFMKNVRIILKKFDLEKLKLKELFGSFEEKFELLNRAYGTGSTSELTPQLKELDIRRDQAIICLRMMADAFTHHFEENLRDQGRRILNCIDNYGTKLYSLNYSAETAVLNKLYEDFTTTDENSKAIKELKLDAVLQEMNEANQLFEQLFVTRLEETSQDNFRPAKELNKEVIEIYKEMVKLIDAYATIANNKNYGTIIDHLNENIEHFNNIVERRKSTGEFPKDEIELNEFPDGNL